jgi:phosphomannomutase
MITASHNPKDDNGFKLVSRGESFFNQQIQDLLSKILATDWSGIPSDFTLPADLEEIDVVDRYIARILRYITINPKLKVAWDPGNGAAGKITELLKMKLPNSNIVINSEIDGTFPNHHPDPNVTENIQQLIELVTNQQCDVGIAFDGDADRIALVSKSGRVILGDQILCIFAKDIIDKNPNAEIIMDIKSSEAILKQINDYGGKAIMWKTGHAFIKKKMRESKALLGGETSGHIFFADKYYGYDDAIYAAIRFLEILSNSTKSLDNMIDELPQYFITPEIKIAAPDNIKFKVIEQMKDGLIKNNIAFNDIDGIKMNIDDNSLLLRASNTEAKIIARCESTSREGLSIAQAALSSLLAQYGLSAD